MAGIVRDASGAILPGVNVEAAGPALIEKSRAVVTDGTGQYRIVDLKPGTYTVTFTLTGFSTVRREGIELTGAGVTTINADLRVGAVEETITVSGATPVVDTQTSTKREVVLSSEVLAAVPATRTYGNVLAMVPGIQSLTLDVNSTERVAQPANGRIQPVLEIDERFRRPQSLPQLVAGDELTGTIQQRLQQLKRLIGEIDPLHRIYR